MKYLYNSWGQHIATENNDLLYSPSGRIIGRFLGECGIFVNLEGKYLGEILCLNRLVYDRNSKYLQNSFGAVSLSRALHEHMRNEGTVANYGPLVLPPGFEDVRFDEQKLA